MRLIGIIGQSGAGKSTVCAALAARGYRVLDGDALARDVTTPGSPVLAELAAAFGADILGANGELKRHELARRAFASATSTKLLNAIMHPAIARKAHERLDSPEVYTAFLEGAALLESPLARECAALAAVTAPEELRLARLLARDKLSAPDLLLRMSAQRREEDYCANADFVIVNDGVQPLEPQIDAMLEVLE
ncbi:MAG: dephospho-CoA kinase [Oscillospiraceae bacterium]|nr:dephospho-CoA kinase [Oscillospiraceae bacterium]